MILVWGLVGLDSSPQSSPSVNDNQSPKVQSTQKAQKYKAFCPPKGSTVVQATKGFTSSFHVYTRSQHFSVYLQKT